jgi:hypothetical protein
MRLQPLSDGLYSVYNGSGYATLLTYQYKENIIIMVNSGIGEEESNNTSGIYK